MTKDLQRNIIDIWVNMFISGIVAIVPAVIIGVSITAISNITYGFIGTIISGLILLVSIYMRLNRSSKV